MKIEVKKFEELTTVELYSLLKLRTDVFVVEQNCPYPELDDKDQIAIHVLGYHDSQLAAYTRIFAPSDYFENQAAIGRVVTGLDYRKLNLGREIFRRSIEICKEIYGDNSTIKIAAQTYLNSFYASFGFNNVGEEFLEDDIPHIYMVL